MIKMEKLNVSEILKETSKCVIAGNGYCEVLLKKFKRYLKDYPEYTDELKNAIIILKEIIAVRNKLESEINKRKFINFKSKLFFISFIIVSFVSLSLVIAEINYKINGTTKLSVSENYTKVSNILIGESPLRLEDVVSFVNISGDESYSKYIARSGQDYSNVSADFENVLINQLSIPHEQLPNIHECWWDKSSQIMHLCINHGAPLRATTIRRSFQIVGNVTDKPNDENFTLCEGVNYIDCSTDITGADLFVQDDIEASGSVYANENIVAFGIIYALGIGDSGSYISELFATQVVSGTVNATEIYADLVSATNMTMSSVTHMIGTYSNNEAYVCVNNDGTIYAKDSSCT